MKPNTKPQWGRHNIPALPERFWTEAKNLVVLRLTLLKPEIPRTHWDTMIREDDPIMVDSIIEVAVELANGEHLYIVPLRSLASMQENSFRLCLQQRYASYMKLLASA